MNKLAIVSLTALVAFGAAAAPRPSQNHVPDVLDKDVRPFYAEAATRANIALINAADAIPAAEWPLVSTYAASRINLNIWTNDNPNAKIKIQFLRGQPKEGLVVAPMKWAKVDVAQLETDNPDAKTLRDRRAKLVLRAIAHVCGGGFSMEPVCSMFFGAQSLKAMDATNITLSPMCYFPLTEALSKTHGDEITSPAEPDGE